jgi:predicted HTH transcriptional regulator
VSGLQGQVYVTREALGKVELTKDVAAFANSGGGYILIGVQTTKSPLHKGDDIIAIKSFAQDVCGTDSYRNVINAGIYPSLARHVRVNWYPSKADKSKGIVAIRVPPECKSERPYLISHVEVEAQGITTGKLIGFYERIDDDAEPMKVQELRELLKKGMDSGVVLRRLDDMQVTLAG